MKILVTGGAGYIGATVASHLIDQGHQVTVLDSLVKGHREAVNPQANFIKGDIGDDQTLNKLAEEKFETIFHFASLIEAGESMQNPAKYFEENAIKSHRLINWVVENKVRYFIFSSTAAVYRSADKPLKETDPIEPANVYGQTKRMIEEMLYWYHRTSDLKVCILRYFNAAGASQLPSHKGKGEAHQPESHLIPNVLKVANGLGDKVVLFGSDYQTDDGTCVRDYIHVDDLAAAHLLGLEAMVSEKFGFEIFNLGNGEGYSNLTIVEKAREVTGHEIPMEYKERRAGDAPRLIADSSKARLELGWQPQYTDIAEIIRTAWEWHRMNPEGYGDKV